MSLQLPEGLQQMLAGAGGPPQGAQPPLPQGLAGGEDDQSSDPLGCLKDVLDDFPKLLTELTDPRDVQDAVKAMHVLTGIQTRLMSAGQAPGGAQAS